MEKKSRTKMTVERGHPVCRSYHGVCEGHVTLSGADPKFEKVEGVVGSGFRPPPPIFILFSIKKWHEKGRGAFTPCASPGSAPVSARALVKKTQEPGIKLQKADFFRNDTWTSPQTNSENAPKIPLVHFF